MKVNLKKNQKANFFKILLDTAKIVTIKMHNSCQKNFSILVSAFILVIEVWVVVKEFSVLSMTSLHVFVCAVSGRLFVKIFPHASELNAPVASFLTRTMSVLQVFMCFSRFPGFFFHV